MNKILIAASVLTLASSLDNADMVQMQLGSESSSMVGYYYYDASEGQKWLANMTFSIAGLDYSKIMASGPLHFGVLWNIKSEIASGFGVPFENVSIFLSDAGNLNIAAVVVGPWMTKLDNTPDDIDIHLLDRIKAIPDIDSAKKDGFLEAIRLSVSVRRHDDGVWTTTTTTTSDGRRRRSPATHAPTAAPALCTMPYMGQNVVMGGQNTAVGTQVEFTCANDAAGFNKKYPATGMVECDTHLGYPSWKPVSSGSGVNNWGCGGDNDCWELPVVSVSGAEKLPATSYQVGSATSSGGFQSNPGTAGSVRAPWNSVAAGAQWCGNGECCSASGSKLRFGADASGADGNSLNDLVVGTNFPTCASSGGTFDASQLPTSTDADANWYCQAP